MSYTARAMILLTEAHQRQDAAERLERAADVRMAMHGDKTAWGSFERARMREARPKPKRRKV